MTQSKHYTIERVYVEKKGTLEERRRLPVFRATFRIRPTAYVSNGVWKDITFKIHSQKNIFTNLAYGFDEFMAGGFPAELEDGGILYKVRSNKTNLNVSLIGAKKSKAKIEIIEGEEWIVYKNALSGVDIKMKNSGHMIPADLYLKSGHPKIFRFKLNMNVANNLTDDGAITLPTGTLPRPVMKYLPGLEDPTKYQENVVLKWQVQSDEIFFELPDGNFKDWVIDPTYTTQPGAAAGLDTYIDQLTGNGFPVSADWNLRTSTVAARNRGLIKFDMSPIPAGSTIDAMTFSYYWDNGDAGNINPGNLTRQLTVDPWTEAGATWATYDGVNAWAGGAPGETVGVDISAANLWSGNAVNGAGWRNRIFNLVEAQLVFEESNGWRYWEPNIALNMRHTHRSSDHATANTRPMLVVDYTPPASMRLAHYTFDIWDPLARIFDAKGAEVQPNELRSDTWMSVLGLDMPSGKKYDSFVRDPGKTRLVSVDASEDGARIVPNPNEFADVIIKRAGAGI